MPVAAVRAQVHGDVQGVGFRYATVVRARELGVLGWVRNGEDGSVRVHAEGDRAAVDALTAFLGEGPPGARVSGVDVQPVRAEGHEQFAVRGVSAGAFAVVEHREPARGFELRLEVAGATRAWALPKSPSMDPAVKRMAFEGAAGELADETVWDSGSYEQGGRVAWPEAIDRGHAVFVLHGSRLQGGFALQRTRGGKRPQWLLIKRRDERARPAEEVRESTSP